MLYNFDDLAYILKGVVLCSGNNTQFESISFDSRTIIHADRTLFFAIEGAHHDGHDYIRELYNSGVRQFVVSRSIDCNKYPESNIIKCTNTIKALQQLAKYHREQFQLDVIGITGSNGKTIVKEWLNQLLGPDQSIVKNPKSYNSQVGVPLSVWQINQTHNLGIFEAGISQVGEMANLAAIIQPKIGIITNIGSAHAGGFDSTKDKLIEKLKLFEHSELLIYCHDHQLIHHTLVSKKLHTLSWGHANDSDIRIISQEKLAGQTLLTIRHNDLIHTLKLPFNDPASIENAMHCIAYMLWKGYREPIINERAKLLKGVPMRLELKQGVNGCKIIDDSYNNDLAGIKIALEFMQQQNPGLSKTIILSDILQTENNKEKLYAELKRLLHHHKISKIITIGSDIANYLSPAINYSSTAAFLHDYDLNSFKEEIILIKGARPFGFEKIVTKLQQKVHGTHLEINLNAISRNLNFYRSKLNPNTKLMVMVKAFGYGSGSYEIAHLLQHHKVDYLGVAYADEGVLLRQNGIYLPIMVMNPSPDSFQLMVENNLEPEVYGLNILNELIASIGNSKIGIHLKIETGMQRLGFSFDDVKTLIELLRKHGNIEVKSIFTHLAGADDANHNAFSKQQVDTFIKAAKALKSSLSINPLLHVVNSAGILRFPEYHYDMVRLGIGLYGVETNGAEQSQLEAISSLKTVVSKVNHVKKGETIGYSRKGVAENDMTIATIAIGYADGFTRAFSNGVGHVIINGHKAPVVGNVCMDMTMVDVTGLDVNEGDEVEIFGKQLSIIDLAKSIRTIPYEILTSISNRVKRVYYLD